MAMRGRAVPGVNQLPRCVEAEYARRYRAVREARAEPNLVDPDLKCGISPGNLHVITPRGAENLQQFPTEFVTVPGRR